MTDNSNQCLRQEKFEKIAFDLGAMTSGIGSTKEDVKVLFKKIEEHLVTEKLTYETMTTKLNDLDKSQYGIKLKFSLLGIVFGIVGSVLTKYALDKLL